ncbi:permease [Halosegnis rubeus]|uniref:Permease n=1 Tax=Halosegnis rubeus TaxID=2212850 RepID=A0A5N5U5X3_9EURY|nr:permease [Halosegnis rubeus]KAB7513938.1 permease [Halosegnis rubeus]
MTQDDTTDTSPENALLRLYERYIGEPETESEVYLGFGLFFAGITCAALGLVLFVAGASFYGLRTAGYFALAQPGYLLGMLSVPLALLSVVVLLPTERRAQIGGLVGITVTVVASIAFLLAYPEQWFEFGTQNTLLVVGTYAVGLALLAAVTGSALVAHQLEQATVTATVPDEAATDEPDESVSDEDVRADIDAAMSNVELSWGGVEKDSNRDLSFREDYADEAGGRLNAEAEKTVNPGGVDAQVEGLRQLKGGDRDVQTSESTVDDQTAALNELRQQKRNDEVDPVDDDAESILARLRSWLSN